MSRVERREQSQQQWQTEERRRQPIEDKPSKAEGEEDTVDLAVQKQGREE